MKAPRIEKAVAFGLVTAGLLVVVLSGELALPVWLAAFVMLGVAWPRFGRPPRGRGATVAWNVVLTTLLLGLVGVAFVTGNWLLHMTHFGIVMALSKLFWVRKARDLLQLYALSFLLVVSAAVINPGLSFAVVFLVYVVLLTWGLILLHLRRDMETRAEGRTSAEDDATPVHWRASRLVTPSFLVGTSLLALAIFASSLLIFFLFPRLGLGFFFAKTRGSQAVSGFGDDLELGHFGTIRDDEAVVMRVELPDEPTNPNRRLRLRGLSFDQYDGRGWRKSERAGAFMPMGPAGFYDARPREPALDPATMLRQEVYLEPLETGRRVVFGTPAVRYLRRPDAKLQELREQMAARRLDGSRLRFTFDRSGDVSYTGGHERAALRYTVLSDTRAPVPAVLRAAGPPPAELAARYLALPPTLDGRIAGLARELTAGATDAYDRAAQLERRLRSGWTYSLEGGHDPGDPLADFLFGRKAGHCEYFATAMAVLARSVGLPARVVNGFYGGVFNPYGSYYAIRQADAHSWVEIYYEGAGWVTYDPTPPSNRYAPAETGLLADLSAWIDALQLRWYKWIIEYDLDKQVGLLRDLLSALDPGRGGVSGLQGGIQFRALKDSLARVFAPRNVAVVVTALVLIVVGIRALRRRLALRGRPRPAHRSGDPAEALRLFRRVERRFARLGVARAPAVPPREWAARVIAAEVPGATSLGPATRALEDVLWGGRALDAARRTALRSAAKAD